MTTREQLTYERLNGLIEYLVTEGVIDREWADALEATRELGDGRAVAAAARDGRGPPDHAGGKGDAE